MESELHPEELSTGQLFQELGQRVTLLVQKEITLAKAELRSDVVTQLSSAKLMGSGALCALVGLNMLFVAGAFALGLAITGWLAALLIAAALFIGGGVLGWLGWSRRVRAPLAVVRKSLQDDIDWARGTLH